MADARLEKSKKLSKLNLNSSYPRLSFKSYWCRVAFDKYDIWNLKEHSHSFFELHLCLEGKCEFDAEGTKYTVTKGTYILLPPEKKHTILNVSGDFEKFIWGFKVKDEAISSALAESCPGHCPSQADKSIFHAIDIIMDNADKDEFGALGIIDGQLHYILSMLIRQNTSLCTDEKAEKSSSSAAKEILSFIKSNLSANMSVSDISAQFYMSSRQITRICRKEYGKTIKELVTSARLEYIRELLSDRSYSLKDIALKSGFADEYSMGKFFKKHEGLPPGKYRYSLTE